MIVVSNDLIISTAVASHFACVVLASPRWGGEGCPLRSFLCLRQPLGIFNSRNRFGDVQYSCCNCWMMCSSTVIFFSCLHVPRVSCSSTFDVVKMAWMIPTAASQHMVMTGFCLAVA